MPIKSAEAEGYLEKAIKLHSKAPEEYWNRLAECLWIQGKVRLRRRREEEGGGESVRENQTIGDKATR